MSHTSAKGDDSDSDFADDQATTATHKKPEAHTSKKVIFKKAGDASDDEEHVLKEVELMNRQPAPQAQGRAHNPNRYD